MNRYEVVALSEEEQQVLRKVYEDLMALAECKVPAVQAHARTAVAHIAQALNGEGLGYDLYTKEWS